MAALYQEGTRPKSPRNQQSSRSTRSPSTRSPSTRSPIQPFGPLRFDRSKFFTFKHELIDIPLKDGPVTRDELRNEIHKYETIVFRKYGGRDSKSFCRGSDGINEPYLMGRVQGGSRPNDAVVYYYDTENLKLIKKL
jgi:hypothetical protein